MKPLFHPKTSRKRHQLIHQAIPCLECGTITSIEALRGHLQTAIEIEHSTIPPYLTALYSLKEGSNPFAYQTIQAVVMEEMLHMILAANILNAIGGTPVINKANFVPNYPSYLPHSDEAFKVPLQKFDKDTLGVFLQIEKPAAECAPPQPDNWSTIGQFYLAITYALRFFDALTPGGIFTGDAGKQLTENDYYGGGGKLVAVHNLDDALLAINEIVGQGEGMNSDSILDTDHELFGEEIDYAHYFKFNEVMLERRYCPTDTPDDPPSGAPVAVDWAAVYNIKPNPKMADYPTGSPLWQQSRAFNQTYTALLDSLHNACNGQPAVIKQAVPLMFELKYQAQALMKTPYRDGMNAGPSFEFVPS